MHGRAVRCTYGRVIIQVAVAERPGVIRESAHGHGERQPGMTIPDTQSPDATPTMRDVASYAQVSPITVSRALRDDPRVSPTTKAKVLTAVTALGYRRNEAARNLRLGRSDGLLGLVVANLANPFYAQLALGVESVAAAHGMRVLLGNSGEDPQQERQLAQEFASRGLDGIIAVPSGNHHAYLAPAALAGTPVVLAASPPSNIAVDAVLLDDFGGTWEAARELVGRGHTRIGFLGPSASTWTGSERFRGFCAALEEAGLIADERHIARHQRDVAAAQQAAGRLLDQPDPPTALFAANNRNTIGAYRAIRERRSAVTLAGFDDFELADMLALPLIIVAYDPRELGRQAARLLCERVRDPQRGKDMDPRQVTIPTTLIEYTVGQPTSRRDLGHYKAD
jgi:LacI family transcriptional regulator